jgi:Protein of unknown function (DUF995)
MTFDYKRGTPLQASGTTCNVLSKIALYSLTVFLTYSVWVTLSSSAKAQDQITADAERGRALFAAELRSIYENRTWPWEHGAAYFAAANHRFIAWLDTDKTYAEGSWSVNDNGRLCFDATWYGVEGHSDATACFEHRTEDKNIYKRALPDGKWYIFSHLPTQPGDELKKLQLGDQVSENYQKNKTYLAEHKDSIGDEAAKARYLTAKELTSTYEGHTWQWDDGAAYFAPNRTFIAWANNGIQAAYADGSWSVSDQGRLCSNATWHGRGGNGQSTMCWEARIDEKTIYQRKLPAGKWYILAHFPARADDGIQKLEPGDHVSAGYQRNKRSVVEAGDGKGKK